MMRLGLLTITVCLLHQVGATVIVQLTDLSTNYNSDSSNWTYLASELLKITDTESPVLSTGEDLGLALRLVVKLMDSAVTTLDTDNQTTFINTTFEIVNNLVDTVYTDIWSEFQSISIEECKSFLLSVDTFGHNISKLLKASNITLPNLDLRNIEVIFKRLPYAEVNDTLTFTNFESTLRLNEDAIFSTTQYIGITAIGYKSLDILLTTSSKLLKNTNYSNQYVASMLVSYSVSPASNVTFNNLIQIQLTVTESHRNWMCGFVSDAQNGSLWSIDGCSAYEEDSKIKCSCNHLSTFAVLGCVAPSLPWQVTTALVLSNLVIVVVFGALLYVNRHYYTDIVVLVLCILATLFLEQLCIVSSIYAVCNRSACKAMALIIHFFDLSIFFWVFGQSVQIALKISYVTMESGGIMQYCALGWITPAFIVASSVGLVQVDYENDQYCAVPQVSHASLGPIVCVVGCTYICLVYLIYGYNNIRRTDNKAFSVIRATKCNIAANGIIITLMFISWLFWTSAIESPSDALNWLWAISVIILGFSVFLLYGVYNPEVQSEILSRFGSKSAVQDGSVAAGRAARSQHQLNEAIRLSQIIENSVVRDQDSVVGGVDCDQIINDSTLSLTQTMTSSFAQRVGFRKARLAPSSTTTANPNAKSEGGTTSNI
ncbi:adhesion G protein-coupled receptor L4-like [Antedon mediterranea]|uniref:adhesion G protein-coupled receptor L4-like n=1 Tax=Antedon mediterranea TaxID=105859 RepID=UPI003AF809E8